ncbi:hypothetical protein GCM10027516_12950 [Niabella aquatica]
MVAGRLSATSGTIHFKAAAQAVSIRPYLSIVEDEAAQYSPGLLLTCPDIFQSGEGFTAAKPGNIFWLLTHLYSSTNAEVILSFKHLTYADLYLLPDIPGAVISHRKAGAFRPSTDIYPGDDRFYFQFRLEAGVHYRVLIRSRHTKQYKPILDFELDDRDSFMAAKFKSELADYWFQGASFLLLIYVMISWINTRYRPYLWLALFICGLLLYNLALSRYLIDWVFPSRPELGWRLIIHFLHLGLAGFYLLLLNFWKLKEKNPPLYRIGRAILWGILLLSVLSFLIHYTTADFSLMSKFNGCFLILQSIYLIRVLLLWKSFDRQERFLAYGVIIYLSIAVFASAGIFIVGEKIYSLFNILSGSILITVSLLFLIGINGKLWNNEKEKAAYLAQLNQLQEQQNQLLEDKVTQRTMELHRRSEHIELLMNELNHRVKNNLQLLYSLNSLQLKGSKDVFVSNILKDNVSRINAMMLANDQLSAANPIHGDTLSSDKLFAGIIKHTKDMFTHSVTVDITLNIKEGPLLNPSDRLCVGLIVTELLTNSYKHAFSKQVMPRIQVDIITETECWYMNFRDNGTGIAINSRKGFGMTLIADLTRQLKGHYQLDSHNGTYYQFNFPNKT